MKSRELIFTKIIECPYPGCKRGCFCDVPFGNEYVCPEHKRHFFPVFEDEKGKRYTLVRHFGESTRDFCELYGNICPKDKVDCETCDIRKSILK